MKRYTASIDSSLPIIAIDIGYSAQTASCALTYSNSRETQTIQFGDCIKTTRHLIEEKGKHTIILEAVLSTYHRPDGNPDIRGDFEKGRGWYYGPGVSTFAAAIRFLQVLDQKLPVDIRPITIVEGFLSYKKIRSQHADDAQRLLKEFFTAEYFRARSGSEPIISEIEGVPSIVRYNHP
ncbi:MAG: hypothetical protein VX372_04890 [Verrucomicrobiota bacterium]|nr:hypothetical protein [Verrucomicrobiota bacterium]